MQVLEKACLIDSHDWPETHRHRRKLPELGHEPGMGIGREALSVRFLAKIQQLLFAEPAFQKCAGINAGRGMTLHKNEISTVGFTGARQKCMKPVS